MQTRGSFFTQSIAVTAPIVIVIVVPDHWHRIITVMAAEAGKDIYCEKPLTFSVADGRAMIDPVRKHDRILQKGKSRTFRPGQHVRLSSGARRLARRADSDRH